MLRKNSATSSSAPQLDELEGKLAQQSTPRKFLQRKKSSKVHAPKDRNEDLVSNPTLGRVKRIMSFKSMKRVLSRSSANKSEAIEDLRVDPLIIPSHETLLELICESKSVALVEACKAGYTGMVSRLLKDPAADPAFEEGCCLHWACARGHLDVVNMLLADARVDPTASNNLAIRVACEQDHEAIVERLLQEGRVDPKSAFLSACKRGSSRVLRMLLNDSRVDPTANEDCAIQWASGAGHVAVVCLLLQDGRANPCETGYYALRLAIEKGHEEIVTALLADRRVQVGAALVESCKVGNLRVVERLLAVEGPLDSGAEALQCAALSGRSGSGNLVSRLLQDHRVDPRSERVLDEFQNMQRPIKRLLLPHILETIVFEPVKLAEWDLLNQGRKIQTEIILLGIWSLETGVGLHLLPELGRLVIQYSQI